MESVQLAISNTAYRSALRDLLAGSASWQVSCVDAPDLSLDGVLVLDTEHLDRLPMPIHRPERVVLIALNEPSHLSLAWEAGVNSVVYEKDPLATAVLAIMAARLRLCAPMPGDKHG